MTAADNHEAVARKATMDGATQVFEIDD